MRQVKIYPANRHLAMISKQLDRIAETTHRIFANAFELWSKISLK